MNLPPRWRLTREVEASKPCRVESPWCLVVPKARSNSRDLFPPDVASVRTQMSPGTTDHEPELLDEGIAREDGHCFAIERKILGRMGRVILVRGGDPEATRPGVGR